MSSTRQPDDTKQPPSPHGTANGADHTPARFLGLSAIMFWSAIALLAIAVILILVFAL